MKTTRLAATLLLTAAGVSIAQAQDLDAYRWRKRVVAVFAPTAGDPRLARERAVVEAVIGSGDDRDLVLVTIGGASTDPPRLDAVRLRRRFHVPAGAFRALLIGKDGHVALDQAHVIESETLTETIDAMPMRRDEMKRRR